MERQEQLATNSKGGRIPKTVVDEKVAGIYWKSCE